VQSVLDLLSEQLGVVLAGSTQSSGAVFVERKAVRIAQHGQKSFLREHLVISCVDTFQDVVRE